MKIEASRELCKGHGQCEMFAPWYFEIDDDALVVLLAEQVGEGDLPKVKDAVSHCPEQALRLVEG